MQTKIEFLNRNTMLFDRKEKKMFVLLLCLTRIRSCSYVSSGAMENSKLRSYG